MIADARSLESGFELDCDLCIVGSGAAGLALANFLNHTRISVCLIESGGMSAEPDTQDLYRGLSTGNVPSLSPGYLHESRLRYFGGTTNHWGGLCRPLEPIDFEERPWVPHSGWPFAKAHLDEYYRRAASYMKMPAFEADNPDRGDPRFPATLDSELVEGKVYYMRIKRFATDHKDEITESRNIRLFHHANATEIVTNEPGRAVQHLRIATLGGIHGTVKARFFVVAAGAIENSRLLLASSARQVGGVGNQHDLVGRYFMEHPVTQFGLGPLVVWPELSVDLYRWHGLRHQVLFPREALMRERRMLTTSLNLQSHTPAIVEYLTEIARGEQSEHVPVHDEFGRAVAAAAYDSDHLGEPRNPLKPPQLLHTIFVCEQEPNPESRVVLGDDRDALGMPRPELSWNLTGAETRTILEMADIVGRSTAALGLGRLRVSTTPDDLQGVFAEGFHHMGTTRMHRDPTRGVVDPDCRVHGIDNLYLAGSSVFPTSGAANPTFTIVALAIRMAEHLKKRFGAI